jgi:hypothetical protein
VDADGMVNSCGEVPLLLMLKKLVSEIGGG